jgi:hypothetical protein
MWDMSGYRADDRIIFFVRCSSDPGLPPFEIEVRDVAVDR